MSKLIDTVKAFGDIAAPEARVWNYKRDVMSLAKSRKQEEVATSSELLFGVELEFKHTSHTLEELYPLLGMGIFKSDSSVDGEYVTLPYTYEEITDKISKLSESFDKLLSGNIVDPLSEVGMHVHLSYSALSEGQLAALISLFGGQHTPEISYLCGRYPNKYCEYMTFSGDRYVACNFTDNTLEIRAFASPTSAEGVLHNLALIKGWLKFEGWLDDPCIWEGVLDPSVVKDWWETNPGNYIRHKSVYINNHALGYMVANCIPYSYSCGVLRVQNDNIEGFAMPDSLPYSYSCGVLRVHSNRVEGFATAEPLPTPFNLSWVASYNEEFYVNGI